MIIVHTLPCIPPLQRDKVSAMVAIANFLLMSAGSQKAWVADDVDLEALEPEELDVLVCIHACYS